MKKNRECVEKIDEILADHAEEVAEIKAGIVDRNELIEYFKLDSDDLYVLEEALKQMYDRVGMLQNAIITARNNGEMKEAFELEVELVEIRELRKETLLKMKKV